MALFQNEIMRYDTNGVLRSILRITKPNTVKSSGHVFVPKWALVNSVLAFVAILTILIAAIQVITLAPRPGFLNENCEKRSCLKELNLKCSNGVCQCTKDQIYLNKCVAKKGFREKCHFGYYCKNETNLVCMDGECNCLKTKYWNGASCVNRVSYGYSCSSSDQCLFDSMLYCEQKKCVCGSSRFWDAGGLVCALNRTYGETCKTTSECLSSQSLICAGRICTCTTTQYWEHWTSRCRSLLTQNQSCVDSVQCYSPMTCLSNKCQCGSFEYHNLTSLQCLPQRTLNAACSVTFNCRSDKYLECRGGSCQCLTQYPTWSTIRDKCILLSVYSGSCDYLSDCDTSKGLLCQLTSSSCNCPTSLSNNKCDCPPRVSGSEYYHDGSDCTPALAYNQTCSASYMCKTTTEGTVCTDNRCQCPSQQYYSMSTTKCENQLLDSVTCTQSDACRSDLGLSCQSGICKCNTTVHFWNGVRCVNYYIYNAQTCTSDSQCKPGVGLICRTSGTSCNCPDTVSSKCDCSTRVSGNEQYWDGTRCTVAAAYGGTCVYGKNYTCQTLKELTYCNAANKCDCDKGVFSTSKCKFCAAGWDLVDSLCYQVDITGNWFFNVCGGKRAKLDSSAVWSYFLGLNLPSTYRYWVDAFRYSGSPGPYESDDGTWKLYYPNSTVWCPGKPSGSGNAAWLDVTANCFSNEDRYQTYRGLCQDVPV